MEENTEKQLNNEEHLVEQIAPGWGDKTKWTPELIAKNITDAVYQLVQANVNRLELDLLENLFNPREYLKSLEGSLGFMFILGRLSAQKKD